MDKESVLPPALAGSSLEGPLMALQRIYESIRVAQEPWIAATPFRCPSGCGACCEGFEPELSEVEALYLAAWVIRNDPGRVSAVDGAASRRGCVLADPERSGHCTVYPGRPLVCRLFAYSGDRGKDGAGRFRPCRRMEGIGPRPGGISEGPDAHGWLAPLGESELLARYGALPPFMGDVAREADLLLPNSAGERTPLREALPIAVARLRYLMELSDRAAFVAVDGDGGNDNPGGSEPPLPRAS